ncbi:IS3 family transposase [Limosilactobacillus avistercoris]
MLKIAQRFRLRGRWTADYRRIQMELDRIGLHLAGDTIRKLMRELNVQVSLYNRHRNGKYSSYHGTVGKIAENRLNKDSMKNVPIMLSILM